MARLDPSDLRQYASRAWQAPERLARAERAAMALPDKVRLAIELYESTKRTVPGWPCARTRQDDLNHHLRLKGLLERAKHVGTR